MDEHLGVGQRATPDIWYRAAGSSTPALAPAPASRASVDAADEGPGRAKPAIDWSIKPVAAGATAARNGATVAAPVANWQGRFVNHLGATSDRLNPNANWRVSVPVAPRLSQQQ